MMPITGPASQSGSFLVYTGEDCVTLREILAIYFAETTWAVEDQPDDVVDEEMLKGIARRRSLCERTPK